MDEWDAMGHGMKVDRRAADWGNVSLRIATTFLLMAPIQLIFNDFYWAIGIRAAAPGEIQQIRVVAPIMTLAFLGLISFSVFAGFRGMSLARATQQPMAMALGGVLIGIVDFIMFLALGINIMAIVGTFQ